MYSFSGAKRIPRTRNPTATPHTNEQANMSLIIISYPRNAHRHTQHYICEIESVLLN